VLNPAVVVCPKAEPKREDFWGCLLNGEALQDFNDLEKLVIGCEIIAVLDAMDLLAA
jgi:hypothetical protein